MSTKVREIQEGLRRLGWPIRVDGSMGDRTHDAIRDFQRGFAFWRLLVDGYVGPKTERAIRFSINNDGRCSEHFRFREWKSKGNGWIRLNRDLVMGLEILRAELEVSIPVTSGYRDPAYNAGIPGAAENSQHIYGNAIDPGRDLPLRECLRVRRFSGIGIRRSDRTVQHLDVRHDGPNTTNATLDHPTIWYYA